MASGGLPVCIGAVHLAQDLINEESDGGGAGECLPCSGGGRGAMASSGAAAPSVTTAAGALQEADRLESEMGKNGAQLKQARAHLVSARAWWQATINDLPPGTTTSPELDLARSTYDDVLAVVRHLEKVTGLRCSKKMEVATVCASFAGGASVPAAAVPAGVPPPSIAVQPDCTVTLGSIINYVQPSPGGS